MTDWRVGQDWFAECLTDWDPAANAMGWQWVAGSGPDAAPYFRVFNPAGQAEKFDADGAYRAASWPSCRPLRGRGAGLLRRGAAGLGPCAGAAYPAPVVDLAGGGRGPLRPMVHERLERWAALW
jgi:deoxyribodipyrimidine photo-lyase